MNLKKEFLVKGNLWKLEYKWRLTNDAGELVSGLCVPEERTIYLDRMLPKEDKLTAFLHELTHAAFYESHLYEEGGFEGLAEEIACASVAAVFLDLFKFRWKRVK